MSKLLRFGLAFLTIFVALAFAGREYPEVFNLADDTSNDGDIVEQNFETHLSPREASQRSRAICKRVYQSFWLLDCCIRLARTSLTSALPKHPSNPLPLLCLLRL